MLSVDELRKRRLIAIGARAPALSGGNALDTSTFKDESRARILKAEELNEIWSVVWPIGAAEDDKRRWHSQSFLFCTVSTIPFGLEQDKGGPCGVLASVQAEMIRLLIFGNAENEEERVGLGQLPSPSHEELEDALVQSMATILIRAATTVRHGNSEKDLQVGKSVMVVCRKDSHEAEDIEVQYSADKISIEDNDTLLKDALKRILPQLQGNSGGVILFLLSLILSRGVASISSDMDMDQKARLTGEYGHCTQELLNLLLCGCAVSNTHDGEKLLGDMILRGIPCRPSVGYLSHLEYLRYVEIGGYYKTPLDPVWVIGSSSHFTVLFGVTRDSIKESESKKLFEKVRRAFQSEDTAGSGFIAVSTLQQVLSTLLPELANDKHGGRIGALASKLELSGAGIIIWSDFWCAVSKMLTGSTLEQILEEDSVIEFSEHQSAKRPRSDSDVARELQAQYNGTSENDIFANSAGRMRSDSEVARQLQSQFDKGNAGVTTRSQSLRRHDSIAKEDAPAIKLFHLNGLKSGNRAPALKECALQKREDNSEIGQGVQLWSGSSGGIADVCAIDEVLRTRWPGCRVQWDGNQPPSLH